MALVFTGPAAPSASLPASPADEATAYQVDAAHDGAIADAGLTAPLTRAWSITLPSAPSYPLIADGKVFVTSSNNNTLYAINQATGSTIWTASTFGSTGIAYDRGQVFEWNNSGDLTAFDAATGDINWDQVVGSNRANVYGAAPTAVNGIVYVTGSSTVFAQDESDGQALWSRSVSGNASSPAVTATGAYASYACQQAYDFDPVSGNVLWHHSTSCTGAAGATTAVASGKVFVLDRTLGNVMLSAADGSTVGSFSAGPPPAVANDVAYMVSGQSPNASLAAIAGAGLGATNWTFSGDGEIDTAPIVANGLVFVGSASNTLYALDASTGATSWSTDLGASPTSLAAANGTLVVSAGSQLKAYRSSGTITDAPSNQSPPTISGPSGTGAIEGADVGIWSGLPSSYAYQWELCDAAGANCVDISGANAPTYTPPAGDLGLSLRVTVTATNGVGSSAPVESDSFALGGQTGTPALLTAPVVTAVDAGTATVGQPLSTTQGTWTNSATGYLYQWQRCDNTGSNCVDIPNATGYLYTPVVADAGYEIRSEVLATNVAGSAASYAPSAPTSVAGAPQSAPGDQATAYRLDATHDGHMLDAGLAAPLAQAWSVTLPGSSVSYPLIADGMVFVTANNTLYAINQGTGSTIWSEAIGGSAGLAYDRGQVFTVAGSGLLSAFNAATGSLAWSYQADQTLFNTPPTAANGIVYLGGAGSGGTVYAVREGDGQLLWAASVENGDSSSPAVTSTGVYVGYACQQDYDFDPVTGALLWHHSTSCEGGGGGTPVVADDMVFELGSAGPLVLSAPSGSTLSQLPAYPPPAIANNVAYVATGILSAVGGDGIGSTAWTFRVIGAGLQTPPIVAGGLVFAGSSNGNLYAFDAATGATDWSTNLGASPTALAAANGTLVVSAANKLMAYRTAGTISAAPSNQAPPTISGSSALNELQAADVGIWSGLPSSYAYQWELCDATGASCADIAGATGPAFTPPAGDRGSTLRVRVVATNGIGASPPIESAASSPLGNPEVLSVGLSGSGSGSVSSDPAGISCGSTCAHSYAYGASVQLNATPATGSSFAGWSGACSGTGSCTVSMTQAQTVTATFTLIPESLTVTKAGNGGGSVTSSPAGISCGSTCAHSYSYGTSVQLTATPDTGSSFAGWTGACSGTGTCTVSMTQAQTVTATFTLIPESLTVTKAGNGGGSVTSSPAGIGCGSTCAHSYSYGASVQLNATPATGSSFAGWSGGGCSGTGSCTVSMTQAQSVTATFTLIPESLKVSKSGAGSGTVSSSPAGISCGSVCAHAFSYGTSVTLTATRAAGSVFTGWSGACTGTSTTCHVSMATAHATTATFAVAKVLTVVKAGTGSGKVTSTPVGISCTATCAHAFAAGTVVTLTPSAKSGSKFTGWSGACSGTGKCVVTMSIARKVTATFKPTAATRRGAMLSSQTEDFWGNFRPTEPI